MTLLCFCNPKMLSLLLLVQKDILTYRELEKLGRGKRTEDKGKEIETEEQDLEEGKEQKTKGKK